MAIGDDDELPRHRRLPDRHCVRLANRARIARKGWSRVQPPCCCGGIAFEVCFAALVVTVPVLRHIFGTVIPQWHQVLWLLPLPFIVWGCDEAWRWHRRRTPGSVAPRSPAEVPQ
nr:cation transporting ATPase C-terminal domain-containing protein [Rhodococcus opacus]